MYLWRAIDIPEAELRREFSQPTPFGMPIPPGLLCKRITTEGTET